MMFILYSLTIMLSKHDHDEVVVGQNNETNRETAFTSFTKLQSHLGFHFFSWSLLKMSIRKLQYKQQQV